MIKKNNKGFTLIEALLTIGLAIIIMAFVFIIYNKISSNVKINNEINNIIKIKGMIDSAYAGSPNYEGISYSMFDFPENMYDKNSFTTINGKKIYDVVNAWAGRVYIKQYNNNAYYSIIYYQVPVEACYKMVTYFTNTKVFSTIGVYSDNGYTLTYNKENIDTLCTENNFKNGQGEMLFSTWGSFSNN